MSKYLDKAVLLALARRTFQHTIESPIAYVVGIFFYGFIGGIFGLNYLVGGQASIEGVGMLAPWVLWFVIPALTMGLISEELRSGTFEQLATLPIRDWEIVLGKFLGFALFSLLLILGLNFYTIFVALTASKSGIDWGGAVGVIGALYSLSLMYGAMGLFASSLAKNQVVALIIGMIFCTIFFFVGQFSSALPGFLGSLAEFFGVSSHLASMSRGVWDLRDFLYFGSMILAFLYFTVQRLTTRRF
jgi:ABC-2 type transport system permease protein